MSDRRVVPGLAPPSEPSAVKEPDGLDELKRQEKEALANLLAAAPEAGKEKADGRRAPGGKMVRPAWCRVGRVWLGLLLIGLGALALFSLSQGRPVNPWSWWWLIFLVKPLFFGWGRGRSGGCRGGRGG